MSSPPPGACPDPIAPRPCPPALPRSVYHILVLVSSAVELVYEVLWMRRFTLLFGGTAPAGAITLSAMFLGMAVGSAVVGRLASRWTRTLQGFALLQFGMAVGAALLETILGLYDRLLPGFYPILSGRPAAFLAIAAALAIAAVAVPSFFMGGILPLASHAIASPGPRLGATLGGLYSMSLLGACFGTVLVPVAILPSLGADGGYLAAIVANLAMDLAAIAMDARRRATTASAALPSPVAKTRRDVHAEAAPSAARSGQAARLLLAFLSGALVMGLEVLWSRMFAMVHENSIYSFAAVLAIFLLGLALGTALARWLLAHRIAPGRAASWAWTAAGLIVIAAPRLFQAVTEGMAYEPGAAGWGALPGGTLLLAAFVLLPAVALCGVFLPSLLDGAREPGDAKPASRVVGELLAWNTAGAIGGPLLFAFGIAPRLGLWWSIAAIGFLLVAGGEAAAIALEPGPSFRGRLRRLAAPVAACAALAVFNPGSVPRARWLEARGQRLVGIFEGSRGTLAVIQDDMSRWVTFNNHYTLGGTASTGDERQQAHIPLLLHPSPRKVAFLGLGTGITAGAALQHAMVESVTILEILPEAVEAARAYFTDANLHVVEDPRAEIIVEDARAFLRFSGRRFDVIVGDLVTPWRPGEALLWSVEHFQSVRRALEPGGIFCQWLPLFQLTEEGFAIVTATFLDVFPGATLWRGDLLPDQPALALIGTVGFAPLDPAGVNARVRALAPRLDRASPYLADPAGFWLFLIGPLDAADPRFVSARRNRDARSWIELLSPFTQRGSAGTASTGPLVGRRLEAALQSIQGRALEGTWLERLSPDERRWRDAGAALWHASLLARAQRGREAFELSRRTLAALPEALQIALTGQVVKQ